MKYRVDFCLLRGKGFSEKKTFKENRTYPNDEAAKKAVDEELGELLKEWEKIHLAVFQGTKRIHIRGATSLTQRQYMARMDELSASIPELQTLRFGGPWDEGGETRS